MKLIVVALAPEGRPFIESLRLKRDLSVSALELYKNDDWTLVISGIGALQSAIATTTALNYLDETPSTVTNIGVAGAVEDFPIGTLTKIIKVTDEVTDQSFYPDLTLRDGETEALLLTVPKPQLTPLKNKPAQLVDMEGTGFFRAAIKFTPLERIALYKIVSDHCDGSQINKQKIASLVQEHAEKIIQYIRSHERFIFETEESIFNVDEEKRISALVEKLRLTSQQQNILREELTSYQVRVGSVSELLEKLEVDFSETKDSKKKAFQEILTLCSTDSPSEHENA